MTARESCRVGHKQDIDFGHFGLRLGMVFVLRAFALSKKTEELCGRECATRRIAEAERPRLVRMQDLGI